MSTNYPSSKQTLKSDWANDTPVKDDHPSAHNDVADTLEALQDKVGIDGDTTQSSFDYKLQDITGSDKAAGLSANQTLTSKTINANDNTLSNISASDIEAGSKSGSDSTLITGTAGTQNNAVSFNSDGDLVENKTPEITGLNDTNGNTILSTTKNSSAVNQVDVENVATGNDPKVKAAGGDTDVGLRVQGKGTGAVQIGDAFLSFPDSDGAAGDLLQTDGSGNLQFGTGSSAVTVDTFTSDGTWNKPSSGKMAVIECWGAGASGGIFNGGSEGAGGGGGGSYVRRIMKLSDLSSSVTVTVGDGGSSTSGGFGSGTDGGDTSFGSYVTANGGKAGDRGSSGNNGAGLAGKIEGLAIPGVTGQSESTSGLHGASGGGQSSANGGDSIFGGAGGAGVTDGGSTGNAGTSGYAGDGGAAATGSNATASDGSAPGGGGGGARDTGGNATSGAGARGKVRVTVF